MPAGRPTHAYLFGTCLLDNLDPEAGVAAAALLRHAGVTPIFPQAQTCCGQPPFNSGYDEEARAVVRTQLGLFPDGHPILVPSGSCAGMMRKDWPRLFEDKPEAGQVADVAARTFELFDFLHEHLGVQLEDKGEPCAVALHVSCSAWRSTQSRASHEALLGQLSRVELRPHARPEECCGFGGTFAVKHGDISTAMVQDKCSALLATGAELLVCGDAGCLMNIRGHLEHSRAPLPGKHLASFLWERVR